LVVLSFSAFAQNTAGQLHLQRALQLSDLYNWAGAASDFAAAEHAFTAIGDNRNALYARLGRIRANIERDQRALPVVSADLADEIDTNPLLQADKQLRLFAFIVKGDIDTETDTGSMRSDWEQVNQLARELGDKKWEYRSTGQLGIAALYDGDTETATKNAGIALEAATRSGDVGAQIRFLTVLAIGLAETRIYEQAIPMFEKALAVANATPDSGLPFTARTGFAGALIGMSQFGRVQQITDETLKQARQEGRKAHEATVLALIARLQLAQGDRAAAMATFQEAAHIAESTGLLRLLGELQVLAAQIYIEAGKLAEAEHFAADASESAQSGGDFYAVPQRLALLATIKMKGSKFTEADEVFDRAEAMIDAMIGKASTVRNKTALVRASSDIYSTHFSLVADHLKKPRKGYQIIEQVRGRAIRDVLASPVATSPEARKAERHIARLRLKLMTARSTAELKRVRDEIFIAEQAHWASPSITVQSSSSVEPADLVDVQRSLPSGTVLLEYVLADQRSYCVVITPRTVRIVTLAARDQIEKHVRAYIKAVKQEQTGRAQARQLYRSLLAPISEASTSRRLVIVRDGVLHTVPFDAFLGNSGAYILERTNITYAPSATSFQLLTAASKTRPANAGLFGVGGVPYAKSRLNRSSLTRGQSRAEFTDLPSSYAELRAAAAAVGKRGKKILTGYEATEAAVKAADLHQYSTIHLAVHGVADPAFPDRAAVVLLSDPGTGEDGFLHAPEIARLKLNADLVILSACDTAAGPLQGQEGIATLSRAFLVAGARSVVSTLWQIDDNASLFLMRHLYAQLAAKKRPEEGLRAAKLAFIRKFGPGALPHLWAGFTFEGAVGNRSVSPRSAELDASK
jgi:CHAT domain-containing protein